MPLSFQSSNPQKGQFSCLDFFLIVWPVRWPAFLWSLVSGHRATKRVMVGLGIDKPGHDEVFLQRLRGL